MKNTILVIAVLIGLSGCAGLDSKALTACGECVSYGNELINLQSENAKVEQMFEKMGLTRPLQE